MPNSSDSSLTNSCCKLNRETQLAWQFIAETDTSVFLTGKAGTGKTTFLRQLKQQQPKRMAVVAPTGVAAINAQGMTIHSFFQLPLGPHIPGMSDQHTEEKYFRMSKEKKNIIRTLDLLVIDEISMVRCDLLDFIDEILRKYRDRYKPFGGVQLLLIGDLHQLAPVAKEDEWKLLSPYYSTPYFFSSHALQQIRYVTIELTTIYRQTDSDFIDLLGKVRENKISTTELDILNSRFIPNFQPPKNEDWIRLTTHNNSANEYNESRLNSLPTKPFVCKAEITGTFPQSAYPADFELVLKEGAQVMFLKNDPSPAHAYYNGKIGIVKSYEEGTVTVFSKEDGTEIELSPATWENTRYELNPDTKEIVEIQDGTFTQYPLRLAWAITIHKSQGLTFEHAVLDFNDAFAHGQTYVALSRCRTLQGLVLSRPVNIAAIIFDADVNRYVSAELQRAHQTESQLPQMQFVYYTTLISELFNFSKLQIDFDYLVRVVDEHLYNNQPDFLALLKQTQTAFKQEILVIADKFRNQYLSILQSDTEHYYENSHLQERIKSAAEYFTTHLLLLFSPIVENSTFEITNKTVLEQYNNAYEAFFLSFKIKAGTLTPTVNQGFSVKNYLQNKAKASLFDLEPAKKKRGSKRTTSKEKKDIMPKKPKIDTRLVTLNLYQQGMTIQEIASERKLQVATIESHLAHFVGEGMLELEDFVSKEHSVLIRKAIESFDKAYSLSEIKAITPQCSYFEIKCVMAFENSK